VTDAVFAIPGDIDLPTGGYAYDRRVLALLPAAGVKVQRLELPGSFPAPSESDLTESGRRLATASAKAVLLIDGLAYGAMPADVIRRANAPIVALVHHPLCLEAGLTRVRQRELHTLEQGALRLAAHVIVTSATTAQALTADFGVPASRITVAVPGTDAAPRAKGTGKPLQLLAVGSVVPRKAFHVLVHALAPLSDLDWRLSIVGSLDRSVAAPATLKDAIAQRGLEDRIMLVGPANQGQLDAHYDAADIFAMPSLYEGYGMVLAEAMARGLPIVCTTGGAAASTVPDAAGIKVPPGDIEAFSGAIGHLMSDPGLRRDMAEASWTAGQALPRWEATAKQIAEVLRRAVA
jgi:glycosyltransferase involved in cell wall biosynthesis